MRLSSAPPPPHTHTHRRGRDAETGREKERDSEERKGVGREHYSVRERKQARKLGKDMMNRALDYDKDLGCSPKAK